MERCSVPRGGCALVTALALAAPAPSALASGFQLREQSIPALSTATAGSLAAAEGPSYLAYNAASMGNLDGLQVSATANAIMPTFELDDISASYTGGAPTVSGPSSAAGAVDGYPFALGVSNRLNDEWALGLSVNVPFGLTTEYDRDWPGRFYAVKTELRTVNINPSVAYSFNDRVTVAVGAQMVYADATLSNQVDYGLVASSQGVPGAPPPGAGAEGLAEVSGDDWGYGYTFGLLVQASERTRIGAAFRSQVDVTLEGDADFGADNPTAAAVRDSLRAGGNVFTDTGGSAEVSLPGIAAVGVHHQATDRLALVGTVEWTNWSKFDELTVEFDDNTPSSTDTENWENTFMVSAGASYALNRRWTLRGGIAYDESPVPSAEFRTPRIPDSDRTFLSVGFTYEPMPRLALSAGYTKLFLKDAEINKIATPANENAGRGNLRADTSADVDLVSIQGTYRF